MIKFQKRQHSVQQWPSQHRYRQTNRQIDSRWRHLHLWKGKSEMNDESVNECANFRWPIHQIFDWKKASRRKRPERLWRIYANSESSTISTSRKSPRNGACLKSRGRRLDSSHRNSLRWEIPWDKSERWGLNLGDSRGSSRYRWISDCRRVASILRDSAGHARARQDARRSRQ